ncbi:hypothetical protein [Candidatus Nitrospira allomarina]|uniref:Uncharacterized protein n=1 Tax=Candidatus Nitrospira allomarina TaxID=3020900 RepID=A0AA96GBD7_9BACT|nr:hypothetical protein [Candidatus Nitrospira allomarina]WNM57892.1 hypothetical protein PP769_18260 [Candidatus Nitrospira allomarina]
MNIPKVKRYQRGDRLYVQAQQIWMVLVAFVMFGEEGRTKRKTITYGKLATKMGQDGRAGHVLGRQLGIIGEYCKSNDLPPLNVIVVTQETGIPGDEVVLHPGRSVRQEQAAVCRENWFNIRVPTPGTFRQVWESI